MGYNDPIPTAPSASNLSFINSYSNNYQGTQQEVRRVSNMKAVLSQCLAALPIFLINFNNKTFYLFLFSTQFSELLDPYNIIYPIGLLVGGVTAQIIGSRPIMMLAAIVLLGGWSIFKCFTSMTTFKFILLWTVRVVELTSGMIQSPSYVYLAEIAQPNVRAPLMAIVPISTSIALTYSAFIATTLKLTVTTFIWINLIFPIAGFVVAIILPESPYWLANKGRYQRAVLSLAWLRGWTTTSNVKTESTEIIDHAQNKSSTGKLFTSFLVSLIVISYVFAIKAFGRLEYFKLNLWMASSSQGEINYLVILDYCYYLLPIGVFVAVAVISKRILILMSLFSGSVFLLLLIIFNVLRSENVIGTTTASWGFPVCFILAILLLYFGIGHVPLLLNGELFPSRLRYLGAGLGLFIMTGLEMGANEIYSKHMHFPSFASNYVYMMLGCINFFGFLTLYYLFPENKNKSIVKIEQSCKSINNLRRRN